MSAKSSLDRLSHSRPATDTAAMRFTKQIRDMDRLSRVVGKLHQIPDVPKVHRSY